MIAGRDFVVFSDAWDGLPTSTMHLFRRIMKQNRVFWFNTINRMPRVGWHDTIKLARFAQRWLAPARGKEFGANGHARTTRDGPFVTSPFMIPWFEPPVRILNRRMLLRDYRRIVRKHGVRNPIVVTTFPSVADFVRSVDCSLRLYYCVDDWLELPGYNAKQFRVMEDQLLNDVDGLIVTSRALEQKQKVGCPLLYLPHGVDFEHFHRRSEDTGPLPELAGIRGPIIGFFGVIGAWFDVDVIATLSRAFPDVSFVLIGGRAEAEISMEPIRCCANVHFLGRIPYADLPRYARHFDVGLIPFVTNRLTEAVNPLKLLEYFALGLPVLATRLPELERIGGPISLASTPDEFCEKLAAILGHASQTRHEAIEIARNNTWEHRAEEFSTFVESLFARCATDRQQ
jgi:glycosyltransferase involved in cell wall biosynthesis